MATKAALKEIAKSRLQRLLANNKAINCADVKIGNAVLFYKAASRKSVLRRRAPASILDIGETDATATVPNLKSGADSRSGKSGAAGYGGR